MNALVSVASVASASALAMPQEAAAVDPAFALIETHRAAWLAYGEALTAEGDLAEQLPKERLQSTCSTCWDELEIVETDDPRWIASLQTVDATCDAAFAAEDAFLDVAPTSIDGVAAVLAYVAGFVCKTGGEMGRTYEAPAGSCGWAREHGVSWDVMLHMNLAEALKNMATV